MVPVLGVGGTHVQTRLNSGGGAQGNAPKKGAAVDKTLLYRVYCTVATLTFGWHVGKDHEK